jgi:hypothetical protein
MTVDLKKEFFDWWSKNEKPGRELSFKGFNKGRKSAERIGITKIAEYVKEFKSGEVKLEAPKEREFCANDLELTYLKDTIKVKDSEIKKLQSLAASEYQIIQMFDHTLARFEPKELLTKKPVTPKQTYEEIVCLLSDIHYGEIVSSEAVLDSNYYDINVVKERLNNWHNGIRSVLNKLSNYNHTKLYLFFLGDMVTGMIHEELKQGTCEVDQVLELAELLSQIVYDLSADYELDISGVIGNHGRMTKKPSFKNKHNNFDYLVYKFVETRCQNLSNVSFHFPKAGMLIKEIQGYNFLLRHGDSKVQSFGGIPFYGVQRASSKITQTIAHMKDMYINYECIGHFHTTNQLEKIGGAIIMNGSLKGGDEYALENMMTSGTATQTIFGVHKEHGKTWHFDLHCE